MPAMEQEETLVVAERPDDGRIPPWVHRLGALRSAPPDVASARLDRLAQEASLGGLVRRLRGSSDARLRYALGGALALGASAFLIVILALAEPPAPRPAKRGTKRTRPPPPPTAMDTLQREPQSFVIPFALAAGLYSMVRLVAVLRVRLQIHAHGFVLARLRRTHVVKWTEIRAVRTWIYELVGSSAAGTYGYVKLDLGSGSGRSVSIDEEIDDLEGVRTIIQEATFEQHYAPVEASVSRGGTVAFGPLSIRHDGLQKGADFQPWSAIQEAGVWDGRFEVKLSGRMLRWCNVKLKHVPNAHVFLAAVEHFRGVYGQRPRR
jgi:hypothetical protein